MPHSLVLFSAPHSCNLCYDFYTTRVLKKINEATAKLIGGSYVMAHVHTNKYYKIKILKGGCLRWDPIIFAPQANSFISITLRAYAYTNATPRTIMFVVSPMIIPKLYSEP